MALKLDVIYNRDCVGEKGIRILPDNCIDLLATDPQYGWNFMGKDWDVAVPNVDTWRQCFRVLKPGAFAFIMSGPRLDCLIENGMRIREAGFMISFTPMFHCFAGGFPKAGNISKMVDKRLGAKREIVINPLAERTTNSQQISQKKYSTHKLGESLTISSVATSQTKALDGSYSGFQPKPSVEVVIVAMKPLSEKTYVDQALKNGKGITWLDEGRIPYKTQEDIDEASNKNRHADFGSGSRENKVYGEDKRSRAEQGNYDASKGRFPANLLCSDDILNDGKSGHSTGHYSYQLKKSPYEGGWKSLKDKGNLKENNNSFSRYFSLDSWWEKKLKQLPESVRRTFPFLIVPKATKSEKNKGCENLYWEKDNSNFGYHQIDRKKWEWLGKEEERIYKETGKRVSLKASGNIHPTIKPLKLGFYLATIGSREGDIILDPFGGSGWMAIVAKALGRHYIIFETIKENVKIAKARLEAEKTLWD